LDKLTLVEFADAALILGSRQFFTTAPAAFKIEDHFKRESKIIISLR